jgi:hypothetical protein
MGTRLDEHRISNQSLLIRRPAPMPDAKSPAQPVLLSGGNPQISKGYGDAPVQAWITATPGWKRPLARRLDALITAAVPDVTKAVKWNSPLYGMEGQGWFLSLHGFDRYIKVGFLNGGGLDPLPPVVSKMAKVRYLHVTEHDPLDEDLFTAWVQQASRLPGEKM